MYCYDHADRLTSTTLTNVSAGAAPVSASSLNTVGPLPSLAYDAHGNTTVLADQTMTYDVADNHVSTTVTGGPAITYLRDVSGSIVQRTSVEGGVTTVQRYTAGAVLDGANAVLQRTLSLPGGASRTDIGGVVKWFYPNLHGDVIVQTDDAGARVGVRTSFDPFGQSIDPATGNIGTAATNATNVLSFWQAAGDTVLAAANMLNGSSLTGLALSGLLGADRCSLDTRARWVCDKANEGVGVTFGNVAIVSKDRDRFHSSGLADHEYSHSGQWAALGVGGFATLWGSSYLASNLLGQSPGGWTRGGGGCLSVLEWLAGHGGGSYDACWW